ncbi:MAG: histidine phosphatase family protein [Oscillospiraceae bacterium]|nr:histidine phosphatase family protein [Oscillospiraceae bacterium]
MNIIIIRHGESVNNLPDISLHTEDPGLTPRGFKQARLLGERFANWDIKIDALFSSPLLRALRTANEISIRRDNLPVQVLHGLMEDGTDYEPMKYAEALKICPNVMPYDEFYSDGKMNVNDPYYNLGRAYNVISCIRQAFPEESSVILTAHGSFNQKLIAAALRTSFPPDFVFSQDNTGVSVVNYSPKKEGGMVTRLKMMNDTSHLYKDN